MLTISGITVRLGGRTILDRATAAIPPGARVGLIGRNGAGKSTLLKVIIGQLEADEGDIAMPRRTRLGYIAQDAPSGSATPFETVLAADTERAALLAEAEHCTDPHRLGDLHDRLIAIDAYAADARAARILLGLGFDEAMQGQPLDSFSGGWKMRVALAALLFSGPDVLLLDEPSNHLDLEATLWLENFLKAYDGTLVVISHERDLLNNVVDTILHLERGKISLYSGNYDGFEKQRAERVAQIAAAQASQNAQRARLQDYVARNSARASTAKQAQSRAKMLAKMQPIAALADDPSLSFDFPSPDRIEAAVDHARHGRGRLCRRQSGAAEAQPQDRSRRSHRAARPQRQRQDHARPPARRPARADGRRGPRLGQDEGRLFHPISGRGIVRRRYAARAYDPRHDRQDPGGGARPARPLRFFRATRRRPWSASFPAANARGWRWR